MSAERALNILCKWRSLLAGWQLGTRPDTDPECQAVRDHREATLILRAEHSALTELLLRKGIITAGEFDAALEREAVALSKDLAKRFPGVTATETGLRMDLPRIQREGWMREWKP
jgi:hypothetical protein